MGDKNYTPEDVRYALHAVLPKLLYDPQNPVKPGKHPTAVFLGGLPGSGKSGGGRFIAEQKEFTKDGIIDVDIDEFRREHPNLSKMKQDALRKLTEGKGLDDAFINDTNEFAWEVTESIIEYLTENKYNFLIQGTQADANSVIERATKYKKQGYSISAVFMGTQTETARQGTKNRAKEMEKRFIENPDRNDIPRPVSEKYFNGKITELFDSIKTLLNVKGDDGELLIKDFKVVNRDREIIADREDNNVISIMQENLNINQMGTVKEKHLNERRDNNGYETPMER
jgi:hypothetical protein